MPFRVWQNSMQSSVSCSSSLYKGHPQMLRASASIEHCEWYHVVLRLLYARKPSFSPFFFANLIRPCLNLASAPTDLQNSVMTC